MNDSNNNYTTATPDLKKLDNDPSLCDDSIHLPAQANKPEATADSTTPDETKYPTGIKLVLILFALALATLLLALDNAIIATANPAITNEFSSLGDVAWYGTAYFLSISSLQLLFGKLYDALNPKWVFISALAIFELGSLLCGVAQSSNMLIVGRAIAGMGGAGIFSGIVILIAFIAPLEKRPAYQGIVYATYGAANVAGPLLGGVFTDRVTWRWCFFINLPLGAFTVAVVVLFLHVKSQNITASTTPTTWTQRLRLFDPFGSVAFISGVICLVLALQWGGSKYPFSDGRIITLFVLFGVLIIIFIALQLLQNPLNTTIPPHLLSNRSVPSALLFAFANGSSIMTVIYFLPLWFQAIRGVSAVTSGIMTLPILIAEIVFALPVGGAVSATGHYGPFMVLGTTMLATGIGLISTFDANTSMGRWIGYQVLTGAGIGTAQQQAVAAVQTALEEKDAALGIALTLFVQTLGGAVFVSVAQTVFSNKLVHGLVELVPGVDPRAVLEAGATNFQRLIPAELLPAALAVYNDALTRVFLVLACVSAVGILGSAGVRWQNMKTIKSEREAKAKKRDGARPEFVEKVEEV